MTPDSASHSDSTRANVAKAAIDRRTGRRFWRDMVHWFDPRLLLNTLFVMLAARLFGRYADRRERLQARPFDGAFRYDAQDEIWLDYVADLGDGWNSTATVASLLAAPELILDGKVLPHGRVLVMGGDAVYPAASREAYRERLEAPYYSLLPFSPDESPRDLFVLPGNHDWYDGLAAFSRLFMQQRWFAGWRTRQSRSYFVLRLPQRWWYIAADIQLDNDIDAAQLEYLLEATADIAPGDPVLLACAEPFWLAPADSKARRNLAYLERRLVAERGAQVRVSLAGDMHHYQRHADDGGAQRIVSGGGGAFLHGTAWQPSRIAETPVETPERTRVWQGQALFPTPLQSRIALWRLLFFPLFNRGASLLLGGLLALLLWSMDSASNGLLFGNLALGVTAGPWVLLETLPASPWLSGLVLAWFMAFVSLVELPPGPVGFGRSFLRTTLGMLHGGLHFVLGLWVLTHWVPSPLDDPLTFFASMFAMTLVLALFGGFLFGAYLFVTYQFFGLNQEKAFSACRIADWKHFLRLHVAADGTLTVRVIGIPRVCRRWRERSPDALGEARVEAVDGVATAHRAVLVETLVVSPRG